MGNPSNEQRRLRLEALKLASARKPHSPDAAILESAAIYERYINGGIEAAFDFRVVRETALEEMDRCARAYGYEIGKGHPLTYIVHDISEDNPFRDEHWKSNCVLPTSEGVFSDTYFHCC